jgi:hypothetical protein
MQDHPKPPRYQPEATLPTYAFVPGRNPHPTRHPDGHSYGPEPPLPTLLPAANWIDCPEYLRGADLYNLGYFWEAHEAWEGLWVVAEGHDQAQRLYLQGMIQLSAAMLKLHMSQPRGFVKLTASGAALIERSRLVTPSEPYMGLRRRLHLSAIASYAASAPSSPEEAPLLWLSE